MKVGPISSPAIAGEWHSHGGWSFAVPPGLTPRSHPAIWRASEAPSVITIHDKLSDYGADSIRSMLGDCDLLNDRMSSEGRHLVLGDGARRHRLLLKPREYAVTGYVIPRDRWLTTRLAAIQAFDAARQRPGTAKSNALLSPTAYQQHRLSLLLNVLDAMLCGDNDIASTRDIAQKVVFPHSDLGRAIEWKSSSYRRQTQRLMNEARFLVRGGYRLLLKGRIHP